jgi:hypothetical protein
MPKHYYFSDLRVIAKLIGANMNSTDDQLLTIQLADDAATAVDEGDYIIDGIYARNASVSLTTAVGGIYTAAAKGGTQLVANSQVYSALTAASKYVALTRANTALTDVFNVTTQPSLYFSLTTPQGAAATADLYVYGRLFQRA